MYVNHGILCQDSGIIFGQQKKEGVKRHQLQPKPLRRDTLWWPLLGSLPWAIQTSLRILKSKSGKMSDVRSGVSGNMFGGWTEKETKLSTGHIYYLVSLVKVISDNQKWCLKFGRKFYPQNRGYICCCFPAKKATPAVNLRKATLTHIGTQRGQLELTSSHKVNDCASSSYCTGMSMVLSKWIITPL